MTRKELQEKLNEFPPDMEVWIHYDDYDGCNIQVGDAKIYETFDYNDPIWRKHREESIANNAAIRKPPIKKEIRLLEKTEL